MKYQTLNDGIVVYEVELEKNKAIIYKEQKEVYTKLFEKAFIPASKSAILLKIGSKYLFVGNELYEFTPKEEIISFHAPLSHNNTSYPYAYTKNYIYYMLEHKVSDRAEVKTKDPYQTLYGFHIPIWMEYFQKQIGKRDMTEKQRNQINRYEKWIKTVKKFNFKSKN